MPFASTFYDTLPGDGVKETTWAQSAASRGSRYGVVGKDDFALTAHPSTPYAVNIGPGQAWGDGVWDDVTGVTTVLSTAPANNVTRWDMIAIRRDWQPTGGGPSAFRSVPGTASQGIPSGRENRPGIVADQPLWLIQWQGGQTQPRQIIDLRAWAGPGGIEIAHLLARNYLAAPGAAVKLGRDIFRFEKKANNVWDWGTGDTEWVDMTLGSTPGVPNVRHAGNFVRVQSAPCQARIVNNMIQMRGELSYVNTGTPSYTPTEGAVVAILPANMRPTSQAFIMGTTNGYKSALLYVVNPNGNISLGPGAVGKIAQFNGVAPLN